jgi:2,3,4,5-tetrahydropyridine-2-carboxylate N-succinyltransferase
MRYGCGKNARLHQSSLRLADRLPACARAATLRRSQFQPQYPTMSHEQLSNTINAAFERRADFSPKTAPAEIRTAVDEAIALLDAGQLRVAEKKGTQWVVNEWLKKAVLLSFRLYDNRIMDAGYSKFFDKVDLKYSTYDEAKFRSQGARVVPPAIVRRGAFIASNAILMPSYVNIGAYVGEGTMVDTWATVGSCAQIGRNVHLSGGVGIGGVLEPLQASPTIIEDNCFIGARSEIVEGVVVEENAVISMGVFIGQSTPIYDREHDKITYGKIPSGAVVVSGSLPKANGKYNLYCAVIVKRVDAQTRSKVGINELLRSAD